jgi:hypothetical protein
MFFRHEIDADRRSGWRGADEFHAREAAPNAARIAGYERQIFDRRMRARR